MGTRICHSVISQMINFFVVCCFVNPGSDPGPDPGFILSLSRSVQEITFAGLQITAGQRIMSGQK